MALLDAKEIERGDEKGTQFLVGDRPATAVSLVNGEEVNASGHKDQLQRQYSIWSICGLALTIDNAWVALGGSIVVAIGRMPMNLFHNLY